jgi:hypothetical protein
MLSPLIRLCRRRHRRLRLRDDDLAYLHEQYGNDKLGSKLAASCEHSTSISTYILLTVNTPIPKLARRLLSIINMFLDHFRKRFDEQRTTIQALSSLDSIFMARLTNQFLIQLIQRLNMIRCKSNRNKK